MLSRKTIYMPEIGEVLLVKNKLSRRISIKVKPSGIVSVSVPWRGNFSDAETFLVKKQEWLKEAIQKTNEFVKKQSAIFSVNKKNITLFHDLELKQVDSDQIHLHVADKIICVSFPLSMEVENEKVQSAIKKGIEFAMKHEAKRYLPLRLHELAQKYNLSYKRLTIRDPKTRWGSCSSDDNISLSLQLLRLPPYLIDYVILHELAHTVHKNHSREFWNFLETISIDARKMAREMKRYTTSL